MKQTGQKPAWKKYLAAAAAAVLLIAGGFGLKSLLGRDSGPADAGGSEQMISEDTASAQNEAAGDSDASVMGKRSRYSFIKGDTLEDRLSYYLTCFAQQEISNLKEDLDEDAELVRFAFRCRRINDPNSFIQQVEDGVSVCTLTLDQVNDTLTGLLGKTVSPDREDYSILSDDGSESFQCAFRDGNFRFSPPYSDREGYSVYFAKAERVDKENCSVHFRVYRANTANWIDWEIHMGLFPAMPFSNLERKTDNVSEIGEGDAVLRDLGDEMLLTEYVTVPSG